MVLSVEELLVAPTIPANVPPFKVIRECELTSSINPEDEDEEEAAEEEVFPCECKYNPEAGEDSSSQACGPLAKCINRELFIECQLGECPCGEHCQNQRFARQQYAKVKVVETPGKGFGLFTLEDLRPGTLVMEYVGEVVSKREMARRSEAYAAAGQRHFYFMTLKPDRIIDATRKGNISRFMNHSCAPNCETQKWIVDGRIRIGLVTIKGVKAGSELSFDYKFVRYGQEPQKCLCGEDCCTGFIGVSEDPAAAFKKRSGKKLAELMNNQRFNSPEDVEFLCEALKHPEEADDLVKLIGAIDGDLLCLRKFMSLHGLSLLRGIAGERREQSELISACLDALERLPIATINSVEDSGWMELIGELGDDPRATNLKARWSQLRRVFKIPRKHQDDESRSESDNQEEGETGVVSEEVDAVMAVPEQFSAAIMQRKRLYVQEDDERNTRRRDHGERRDRRERDYGERRDYSERSRDYNNQKQRDYTSRNINSSPNRHHQQQTRNSPSRSERMIPDPEWLEAVAPDGRPYYYHAQTRETRWERPMISDSSRDRHDSRDRCENRDRPERKDYERRDYQRRDYSRRDESFTNHSSHSSNNPIPTSTTSSNSGGDKQLLEGVSDSSQLAAIIDRAKARRTQELKESSQEDPIETSSSLFDLIPTKASTSAPVKDSRMKEEISELVVRFLSHYKAQLGDDFKDLARKYTHRIMDKESDTGAFEMTAKKRAKIKTYLAESLKNRNITLLPEHAILLK